MAVVQPGALIKIRVAICLEKADGSPITDSNCFPLHKNMPSTLDSQLHIQPTFYRHSHDVRVNAILDATVAELHAKGVTLECMQPSTSVT